MKESSYTDKLVPNCCTCNYSPRANKMVIKILLNLGLFLPLFLTDFVLKLKSSCDCDDTK